MNFQPQTEDAIAASISVMAFARARDLNLSEMP